MAIAFTARDSVGANTTNVTSSSFTPSANSRLFAFACGRANSAATPTISDSNGGSWTLVTGSNQDVVNIHTALYYCDIGGSPSARTVTATSTSATNIMLQLFDVTGHSSDLSNFVTDTDTAGDPSLTMGAFSTNSIGIALYAANAGSAPTTTPTGYSSIYNASLATNLRLGIWNDTTSPGTAISWVSTSTNVVGMGLEIKEADAGTSAISGSAALDTSASGTLVGAGVLSASASWSFAGSGTMLGAGAASGTSTLTFTGAGNLGEIKFISGEATLSFTATGNFAFSGTTDITFTTTGTLGATGDLAGEIDLPFDVSGNLGGDGILSGSSSITLTVDGTADVVDSGSMVASGTFTLTSTGTLDGTAVLTGSSPLTFTPTGVLTGVVFITGTTNFTLSPEGNLRSILIPYFTTVGTSSETLYELNTEVGTLYQLTSDTSPEEIYEETT